jgi:hypothetical protein
MQPTTGKSGRISDESRQLNVKKSWASLPDISLRSHGETSFVHGEWHFLGLWKGYYSLSTMTHDVSPVLKDASYILLAAANKAEVLHRAQE